MEAAGRNDAFDSYPRRDQKVKFSDYLRERFRHLGPHHVKPDQAQRLDHTENARQSLLLESGRLLCRFSCRLSSLLIAGTMFAAQAHAQATAPWPERPIRIVVPFVAGGAADSAARLLAPRLQERLGQPVVIENRAGGGAILGTDFVATAPADGYTLLMGSASNAIGSALFRKLPYVFEKDLIAISQVADVPGVLVVPAALPVRTVTELIAYTEKHGAQMSFGSPGYGTSVHLAGELFMQMTRTKMIHVPYKGAQPALVDLTAGRIQMMFPALAAVQPHVQAGRLKVLAVTSRERSALAPTLPTLAEAGIPGYAVGGWIGLFAPAKTPAPLVERLARTIGEVLQLADVRESLTKAGVEPKPTGAKEFATLVASETRRWEQLVNQAGLEKQ